MDNERPIASKNSRTNGTRSVDKWNCRLPSVAIVLPRAFGRVSLGNFLLWRTVQSHATFFCTEGFTNGGPITEELGSHAQSDPSQ